MFRALIIAVALSCLAQSGWAQTQPPPGPTAQPAPSAKKSTPKSKAAAKPPGQMDNGACDLGVIAAAGSPIEVKKVGITIFGNEIRQLPSDAWGIDDLIFARVRAAAEAGIAVRRIAYAKDAFATYNHPERNAVRDARENFTAIIRQIAAKSRCKRYIVIARYSGGLPGTNQSLTGVGVYTHGPFGKAAVFAFTRIVVLDGQTFAIREDPFGSFGARMSTALSRVMKDDSVRAANTNFPATLEEAAINPELRDTARALLAERLDSVLPEYLKEQ
jgi:hypothetical protein